MSERAAAIPDERLRRAAQDTLRDERGNLEGAAAFAVLAPVQHRRALVRALVVFQAIYDYVDTLAEQPEYAIELTNRRLHRSLHDALADDADAETVHDRYLAQMVEAFRSAVADLPARATTFPRAREAAERMAEYQARNHPTSGEPSAALAGWAPAVDLGVSRCFWWEAAASAASSLVVFALLALAADPDADDAEARRTVFAYEPVGALHVLLDSHADRAADALTGDHSLVAHYPDPGTEASRLTAIASEASKRTRALRNGEIHHVILCAMASFYVVAPTSPESRQTTRQLVRALGTNARAAAAVLHVRLAAARVRGFRH